MSDNGYISEAEKEQRQNKAPSRFLTSAFLAAFLSIPVINLIIAVFAFFHTLKAVAAEALESRKNARKEVFSFVLMYALLVGLLILPMPVAAQLGGGLIVLNFVVMFFLIYSGFFSFSWGMAYALSMFGIAPPKKWR